MRVHFSIQTQSNAKLRDLGSMPYLYMYHELESLTFVHVSCNSKTTANDKRISRTNKFNNLLQYMTTNLFSVLKCDKLTWMFWKQPYKSWPYIRVTRPFNYRISCPLFTINKKINVHQFSTVYFTLS